MQRQQTQPQHHEDCTTRITIQQQNTNKSLIAQLDMLQQLDPEKLDITAVQEPYLDVRSKCTALLNRKHGRFGRVQALASAHALRLTTYYHVPEYFGYRTGSSEVNPEQSVALEEIECRVQIEARVYSGSAESEFGNTEWVE